MQKRVWESSRISHLICRLKYFQRQAATSERQLEITSGEQARSDNRKGNKS